MESTGLSTGPSNKEKEAMKDYFNKKNRAQNEKERGRFYKETEGPNQSEILGKEAVLARINWKMLTYERITKELPDNVFFAEKLALFKRIKGCRQVRLA